jgi:hypothetical protein
MAKQGDGSLRRLVFCAPQRSSAGSAANLRGQSATDAAVYPSPAGSAIMSGRARFSAPNFQTLDGLRASHAIGKGQ